MTEIKAEEISPKYGKCWKDESLTKLPKQENPKKVGEAEIAEILIKYGSGKRRNRWRKLAKRRKVLEG